MMLALQDASGWFERFGFPAGLLLAILWALFYLARKVVPYIGMLVDAHIAFLRGIESQAESHASELRAVRDVIGSSVGALEKRMRDSYEEVRALRIALERKAERCRGKKKDPPENPSGGSVSAPSAELS